MKGWEVRNLQMGLQDNPYGVFLKGGEAAIDSEYGPMTAQAVHRAKYWLGYGTPSQVCGGLLRRLLAGKAELSPAMKMRRAYRLKKRADALKARPIRLKALDWARSQVGVVESPAGSNSVKYNQWYYGRDVRAPWCAVFVSQAMVNAGSKAFGTYAQGNHYSYTPNMVNDARAGRNNLTVTTNPQPGDIVMYDWEADGTADHTGLFESWNGPGSVAFSAIEGNTSAGDNSNGGQVQHRTDRLIHNVVCFIHVGA